MRKQYVIDRAAALLNELIDLYRRAEKAPHSPLEKLTTKKDRRLYRRAADRLRRGKQGVVFKGLYTPGQFATLLEDIVRHDEMREETSETFFRIGPEIGALMREDAEAVREGFGAVF